MFMPPVVGYRYFLESRSVLNVCLVMVAMEEGDGVVSEFKNFFDVEFAAQPIRPLIRTNTNTRLFDLYPASAVGPCVIYKQAKLTNEWF